MRKLLAMWAGKLLTIAGKLIGKKSSSSPGEFALKICPNLVGGLNKSIKKGIIVTCGTNGKTTTNNLLCAALEAEGRKVVCNHTGSNMKNGVAAALVLAAGADGRLDADYACLEVDEASARLIFPALQPDFIILTNLSGISWTGTERSI